MKSLSSIIHSNCDKGRHVFWPPWHTAKRCVLCGCYNRLPVGDKTLTIDSNLLKWSTTASATSAGRLGMDTSTGYAHAYIEHNSSWMSRPLAHTEENGLWRQVFSTDLTSASTTQNITGCSGNTDDLYVLIARIKGYPGQTTTYYIRPNSIATNQTCTYLVSANGSVGSAAAGGMVVGASFAVAGQNVTETIMVVFHPSYSIGGNTVYRSYVSVAGGAPSDVTGTYAIISGGAWAETSTNITSFLFVSTWAMQAGTSFRLWKVENGT